MALSKTQFDTTLPYWRDYRPYLQQLEGLDFPDCDQLNELLPDGLLTGGGYPIRFVPSDQLEDEPYELRIYNSGHVSTRPYNWHDLFNALVWMRFPRIKTAMNTLHFKAWSEEDKGRRGPLRDALTLFDECGVIVFAFQLPVLRAIAERHWLDAFQIRGNNAKARLSLCGHAMLEKFLSPYKSMTAKALLIHVEPAFSELSRADLLTALDTEIANRMLAGELLTKPADLSPLPLAGVPGWWPESEQDEEGFYRDLQVFRPAPVNFKPVRLMSIRQA